MLFINKNKLSTASLRKGFATKAQRHEAEKMRSIFPLCLRVFVANSIFVKNCSSLLEYL
jgi:hypothetical protein